MDTSSNRLVSGTSHDEYDLELATKQVDPHDKPIAPDRYLLATVAPRCVQELGKMKARPRLSTTQGTSDPAASTRSQYV